MKKNIGKLFVMFVLVISIFAITGCTSDISSDSTNKKPISLGETFVFDDLELTLGTDISFDKIDNQFSEYNGKTVVKVPITVKNLKDETHGLNMFYYKVYGSQGAEVSKSVSSYFKDGVDDAGDLRSGASYTKFIYFIYDGNGKYAIEFEDWTSKQTVEFDVNK